MFPEIKKEMFPEINQRPYTALEVLVPNIRGRDNSILHKLFEKIENKEHPFPKAFNESDITLTSRLDRGSTRQERYKPTSLVTIGGKILNESQQTEPTVY